MQSDNTVLTLALMYERRNVVGWRSGAVAFSALFSHIWGMDDDDEVEEATAALPPEEAPSVCLEPLTWSAVGAAGISRLPPRAAVLVAAFCGTALRRNRCGHAFHAPCLERWARGRAAATCPLCRVPLGAAPYTAS